MKKSKKVELLAPAGSYEGFLGAVRAGADAVYLGGGRFGARAYAENLTEEEVCSAIRYAHLHGRKVYLAVNTLLRDDEINELYEYLSPFYHVGLDAVIVQDIGVMHFIKKQFPLLPVHASTQMAVTGVYGALMLKRMGVERVVPARELNLEEIRAIREETDIEVETFVHGAMCYSYSGNCLFSSLLGGRSGNRGRCAQPCRLPYECGGTGERYLLSMKDMCALEILPGLIRAGIDSFKIEGRMKKPEYTAGVTALYRKYIDRYYHDPEAEFAVSQEDMELLRNLYLRSEIQKGYYEKHNGREMITLHQPGYSGSSPGVLERIRAEYLEKEMTADIRGEVILKAGETVRLVLETYTGIRAEAAGGLVQEAFNRPLTEEEIRKQIEKTGGSPFAVRSLIVTIAGKVFLPVSALNEVRRSALQQLYDKICAPYERDIPQPVEKEQDDKEAASPVQERFLVETGVFTPEQFTAVAAAAGVSRIVVELESYLDNRKAWDGIIEKSQHAKEIWFALPYILRQNSYERLKAWEKVIGQNFCKGVLIRNWEEKEWLFQMGFGKAIAADAPLYCFNRMSKGFLQAEGTEVTLPYELNRGQAGRLGTEDMTVCVYGRIPMMVSANCIRKTTGKCCGQEGWDIITDRYGKEFPVYQNCSCCYNVIYNSVPLLLMKEADRICSEGGRMRINFTQESGMDAGIILRHILSGQNSRGKLPELLSQPAAEYTAGHWKRGVE